VKQRKNSKPCIADAIHEFPPWPVGDGAGHRERLAWKWSVLGARLTPSAKLVMAYLFDRSDPAGESWPTQREIGAAVGMQRQNVGRALRELEGAGIFAVRRVTAGEPVTRRKARRVRPGSLLFEFARGRAGAVFVPKPAQRDPREQRKFPFFRSVEGNRKEAREIVRRLASGEGEEAVRVALASRRR